MTARIDVRSAAPEAYRAMALLDDWVEASSLPRPLLELVRIRTSQINGCAYCLDMHSKDAIALEVPAHKLFVLDAWRDAPFYSGQERAALAWAEALTLIAERGVSDELYQHVRAHFTERELVELTGAVIAINGWNRMSISMALEPGRYESPLGKRDGPSERAV